MSTLASTGIFRRAQAAPNAVVRLSIPFSTPPDQPSSNPIHLRDLLNPAGTNTQTSRRDAEQLDSLARPASVELTSRPTNDVSLQNTRLPNRTTDAGQTFPLPQVHVNDGSGSDPLGLSKPTIGVPVLSKPPAPALPLVRLSTSRLLSQEAPSSQAQNFQCPGGIKPAPLQPASQSNSPGTQYFCTQVTCAEPCIAPHTASTPQYRPFAPTPFPPSDPVWTMSQMAFGASASEVPTSSTTAQSQWHLRTEQGPIEVPIDLQAGSKFADENRSRYAAASSRFRRRQKEKDNKIASLEAKVREMAEERDYYLKERDYLQEVVLINNIPIISRPPSPSRRRHATLSGVPPAQDQEAEGSERSGRQIRRRTSAYVPPQGPPPSTVEGSPIPPFERMTAMHT